MPLLVLVSNDEQEQSGEADDEVAQNSLGELMDSNYSIGAANSTPNNDMIEVQNQEQQSIVAQEIERNALNETTTDDSNDSTNISPNDDGLNAQNVQLNGVQHSSSAQSIAQITPNQSNSDDETSIGFESSTSTLNEVIAIKPEPVFAPLIEENVQAIEDEFNENYQIHIESAEVLAASNNVIAEEDTPAVENEIHENHSESADILAAPNNVMPIAEENAQAIESNRSYENCDESGDILVCPSDVLPMPIAMRNPYEVKQCDILSGNMAYATNVNIFDYYIDQYFCVCIFIKH